MNHQKGAALIVVLSMLTASLMLGLTSMQSSQIDERLAGNYKAASQAQMGAEEAASEGLQELDDDSDFVSKSRPAIEGMGWREFVDDSNFDNELKSANNCSGQLTCYYRYVDDGGAQYIVAMGAIKDGDVSVSEPVFVEVSEVGFSNLSPITFAQNLEKFSPPNSQADFNGLGIVPPVTVASESDVELVENAASGKNLDGNTNANGERLGVSASQYYDILSDPANAGVFKTFIDSLKVYADNYYPEGVSSNNVEFSSSGAPAISYIDGDLSGNGPSGSGILIVDGNYTSKGNPSFQGLVIILGDFTPGGGGGADLEGSLVVAPIAEDGSFDGAVFDYSGGGSNNFIYNEEYLKTAFDLLGDDVKEEWTGAQSGASTYSIQSWQ